MARNKKEDKSKKKSKVHKDLEGFEIRVNEHGEIISNYSIDKINEFLNNNVDDKKLLKRDAADKAKREEEEYHIEEGEEEVEETEEDFVRKASTTSDNDEDEEQDLPRARKKGKDEDE